MRRKKKRGPRKSKLIRCTESESWKIVDHVAQPPIHQDCPWRRITHTPLNHFWDQLAQEGGKSPSLSSHHHLSLQEETFRERRSGKNFSPLSIKEILGNNTSVMISIMCISLTGPQGAQTFGQTALWVCLPGYFWSELSKPDCPSYITVQVGLIHSLKTWLEQKGWSFCEQGGTSSACLPLSWDIGVLLLWNSNSNISSSEVSSLLALDWKQTVSSPGSSASQW